jgi:hypothetical protein
MEIARLVLEYVEVLVWPIVAITIVLLFRSQLESILWRLRKADFPGGVSLDFQQGIQEAKILSEQVAKHLEQQEQRPSIPMTEANARLVSLGLQPSPSGLDMGYYRGLASQDPNIALAGLRIEVDILGKNLARGFRINIDPSDTGIRLLQKLRNSGAITTGQLELALKVVQLCNAAIHGETVSREQANAVLDVADILRDQYLSWLSWGFGDHWHPSKDA